MAAVGDVYQSLKAALDIFKVQAPATSDVPTKQVLVQAAERVKNDAAKIGLMCSGGAPPADQQLSLAKTLQQSCVAFCTLCHAATASAGPSLKDSLALLAQNLVNPCLALLKDMGSGKDLKSHVGLVWERVSAVDKAPMDNKACLFAALARVMAIMKDTHREMVELQEEQQEEYGEPVKPAEISSEPSSQATEAAAAAAAGGNHAVGASPPAASTSDAAAGETTSSAPHADAAAQAGGQPSPSCTSAEEQQQQQHGRTGSGTDAGSSKTKGCAVDADLDFEADEMTYWERQLLAASIALLQASTALLRVFGRALLQGPALSAGSDCLDSWESCVWHSKHLQRAVEDLGAAMYPPQDLTEVCGASQAVFEVTELMSDECPDAEAVGQQQLSSLHQQLTDAHQAVQQWLKQAAEQQQPKEPTV